MSSLIDKWISSNMTIDIKEIRCDGVDWIR